jgi:hypothetical protein
MHKKKTPYQFRQVIVLGVVFFTNKVEDYLISHFD